jgi:hypothetical protein
MSFPPFREFVKIWIDYIKRILFRQFNKETGPAL